MKKTHLLCSNCGHPIGKTGVLMPTVDPKKRQMCLGCAYKILGIAARKCPVCEGTGILNFPSAVDLQILSLRKEGLTLREISKVVGLAANTILYHLRKYDQTKT